MTSDKRLPGFVTVKSLMSIVILTSDVCEDSRTFQAATPRRTRRSARTVQTTMATNVELELSASWAVAEADSEAEIFEVSTV